MTTSPLAHTDAPAPAAMDRPGHGAQDHGRNTFALMGLAALLIANSHLEGIYPQRWMAADGLLGNVMFFVLSGYGVFKSQHDKPYPLGRFLARRTVRIYPSLWIVTLLEWLLLSPAWNLAPAALVKRLLWPTSYGFISQIMLFYPVGWALGRARQSTRVRALAASVIAWLVAVAFCQARSTGGEVVTLGSLPLAVTASFYLAAFLLGGVLSARGTETTGHRPGPIPMPLLLGGLILVAYVAAKFAYYRIPAISAALTPAGAVAVLQALCLATVLLMIVNLDSINRGLGRLGLLAISSWIGTLSLQIYLSHTAVAEAIVPMEVSWPIKLLVFYPVTLIVSMFIEALTKLPGRLRTT